MRIWASCAALVALSLSLAGCQTIVLGAPRFPPCYLDSEERAREVDQLRVLLPYSYEWVRDMDALCVTWTQ